MFVIVPVLDIKEILVKFQFAVQHVLMDYVLHPILAVVLELDILDLFVKFQFVMRSEDV